MLKKIKDLPQFSRPREKLALKGPKALSDQELIAIILGSGNKSADVMTIAKRLHRCLQKEGSHIGFDSISKIDGVGIAKGSQILASFELARRYLIKEEIKISSLEDVLPFLSEIRDKKQEHFVCISLNGANEVIATRTVTIGLLNQTQIHPREVFADVITDRAASIILAHNHPSGSLEASLADKQVHQRLIDAGRILGIKVLDHVIVTKKGWISLNDAS
jgi:DNA repair protein RadC